MALRTAFEWAISNHVDILVTLDADGQHNPDEIPRLIEPILWKKADMVNGARFLKGHTIEVPRYRRLGQEILTLATNMTAEVHLNDSQSGFRAFSHTTFPSFKFSNNGMGVESEMINDATAAGFKITEVPITCRYDVEGSTFNPVKHGMNVLGSIINQFERKHPLLYFGVPGFILVFIGTMLGFWTVYGYNAGNGFWVGKAMLSMTFLLLGCFGMFTGMILNSLSLLVNDFKKAN
jgi:glycosyltransferase involved in cell wall biosynthesis